MPRRDECWECGMPDPYNGAGDGIGSCRCARCPDCGWPPGTCSCTDDPDWDDEELDTHRFPEAAE